MRAVCISVTLVLAAIAALPFTASETTQSEQIIVVTSTADQGPGTLREALQRATHGATITFDLTIFPLENPAMISITSEPLPPITQGNLTIDASTAGVILDGSTLEGGPGLVIESDGNTIKGLQILDFPSPGIMINNAGDNLIGGENATPGGLCTGECNLISRNNAGLRILGEGAQNNTVIGNYIGTDITGKMGFGVQFNGIIIMEGAHDNLIGGDSIGERNLISGNIHFGILITGSTTTYNTVRGNWIGLYVDEERQAFPVDLTISPNYLSDCTLYIATQTTGVHKSTDCGNTWDEVNHGLTSLRLRQVEIPPNASNGETLYALSQEGQLFISSDGAASWRLVSTSMQGFDFRNLAFSADFENDRTMYASAEGWSSDEYGGSPGVFKSYDGGMTWQRMADGMTNHNVRKVIPSPDPAAKEVLFALTYAGVEVSDDAGLSWAPLSLPDTEVADLAVSPAFANEQTLFLSVHAGQIYSSYDGGANWAIVATPGDDPRFLTISPNYANDGTLCHYSDEGGELIFCTFDAGRTWNKINPFLTGHEETWGARFAFSPEYPTDGTIFFFSIAGMVRSTDAGTTWEMMRGLHDLGNTRGINIEDGAQNNTIGPGNVLSNNNAGVVITGAQTSGNLIIGNLVGTDPTGTFAQANTGGGVEITGGYDNLIGGRTEADRNFLSGNRGAGMWLGFPETRNNSVIGNYIGTDITGESPLGNGGEGGVVIIYGALQNIIGGEAEGAGNLISGNENDGLFIGDSDSRSNLVVGNYIGTDASGKKPLGNTNHGVSLNADTKQNVIGPGNTIAFNLNGVAVIGRATTSNRITQNHIFNNAEVGIRTWDGGNNEVAPPTITSISSRLIKGTSLPNATIEVFSDEEDEGSVFEGSVTADEDGNFSFHKSTGRLDGPNITLTTTDPEGNTSPFSQATSPPTPAVTRELPGIVAPTQISTEPTVVGTNLGLAFFSVLFFGLTSTLFNSILVDYHQELTGIFRRLLLPRFKGPKEGLGSSTERIVKRHWSRLFLMWLGVLLLTAIIESFLDPEIGIVSTERLGIITTLFVSAIVVGALELCSDLWACKRFIPSLKTEGHIQWMGLVMAIGCVVLSRALEFRPGYLYGIVGAVYLLPKLTDPTKCGKRATLVLVTVFLGGLLLWIATAFLPSSLTELEPIFLTIFLISLQGVFFELFPLTITDGGDILSWRKGVWVGFFSIVFFCFYHFLLNPDASDVQALQQNGVQTLLILVAIFGVATIALWLFFPFRLRRKKAV